MSETRLFIADADIAHVRRIEAAIAHRADMAVVGEAADGCAALRALTEKRVDLLITDFLLPGLDGILLLRRLMEMNRCPASIVCTHFYSDICLGVAHTLGVNYVLYKPLDYGRLPQLIHLCCVPPSPPPISADGDAALPRLECAREARRQLLDMGVPARMDGALYLIEAAVLLCGGGSSLLRNLSKGLYAQIADRTQATPARVERSMRTAISAGYDRGGMSRRFRCRPSNREFLEYLMETTDASMRCR